MKAKLSRVNNIQRTYSFSTRRKEFSPECIRIASVLWQTVGRGVRV